MRCFMQDNVIKCRFDPYLYLGFFFFFQTGLQQKAVHTKYSTAPVRNSRGGNA